MGVNLTKDADALICILYKHYCEKRKNNESKDSAKFVGGSKDIHSQMLPKWCFEDVDEACRELERAEFLICQDGDNIVFEATLTDTAIIYMENRFKKGLNDVLDYIQKIKSIISPFG